MDIVSRSPLDVQLEILSYLDDPLDVISWGQTCSIWRELLFCPVTQSVYRKLIEQNFAYFNASVSQRVKASGNAREYYSHPNLCNLLKNKAGVESGVLSDYTSIHIPERFGFANPQFTYAEGYLAVHNRLPKSHDVYTELEYRLMGKEASIFVYDICLFGLEKQIKCRTIPYFGHLLAITISNGKLVFAVGKRTRSQHLWGWDRLSITLIDLCTQETRVFQTQIKDFEFNSADFLSTVYSENYELFTDYEHFGASVFSLPGSPYTLSTNGRIIAFSMSFLQLCTVWDTEAPQSDIYSTHGRCIILNKPWIEDLNWGLFYDIFSEKVRNAQFCLNVDEDGDIYMSVNMLMFSSDGRGYPSDEWLLLRSARKPSGEPIPIETIGGDGLYYGCLGDNYPTGDVNLEYETVDDGDDDEGFDDTETESYILPQRYPGEGSHIYLSKKIRTFLVGKLPVHVFDPDGSYKCFVEPDFDIELNKMYRRYLIDTKGPRVKGEWDYYSPIGDSRNLKAKETDGREYCLNYLRRGTLWPQPIESYPTYTELSSKVIPGLHLKTNSPPIVFNFLTQNKTRFYGKAPKVDERNKLKIVAMKAIEPPPDLNIKKVVGRTRSRTNATKNAIGQMMSQKSQAVVGEYEVKLGPRGLREGDYAGDDQWIVVLHQSPKEPKVVTRRAVLEGQGGYENVIKLFRYGIVGPMDLEINYDAGSCELEP